MSDALIQFSPSSFCQKSTLEQYLRIATELPTGQSERQLMLDRQSACSCWQLSQAQSPLAALVGGEPSFGRWSLALASAGHKVGHRFSRCSRQCSRFLAFDKLSAH